MIPRLKRGVQRTASKQVMEVSLCGLCLSTHITSNKAITRRHCSQQPTCVPVTLPPKWNLELLSHTLGINLKLCVILLHCYWNLLCWRIKFLIAEPQTVNAQTTVFQWKSFYFLSDLKDILNTHPNNPMPYLPSLEIIAGMDGNI